MTAKPGLVLAATGLRGEAHVVRSLTGPASGFRLHKRVCDVIELSTFGAAGSVDVALVSPAFPRITLDLVESLVRSGTRVVAVVDEGDETGERVARQWRLEVLVVGSGDPARQLSALLRRASAPVADASAGRLLAVCGPIGATGRSTVALNLATLLGGRTLLVDGAAGGAGTLAFQAGVPEEPAGLQSVCAQAERGVLDHARLLASCVPLREDLWLCSASPTPCSAPALDAVVRLGRSAVDTVVWDCGADARADPDGAVEGVLAAADLMVVTASPDAIGIRRLAHWLVGARGRTPAPVVLVWNGLRQHRVSALGRRPLVRLEQVVDGVVDVEVLALPRDDEAAVVMDQRPGAVVATAPRSALAVGLADLARSVEQRLADLAGAA